MTKASLKRLAKPNGLILTNEPSRKTKDDQPTFEEALTRLNEVVRDLEQGNVTLDESLLRYEEGVRRLSQCQKILSDAERKIEVLSGIDADGNPITQRFDEEEMTLAEKADSRSRRRTARPTPAPTVKKAKTPGNVSTKSAAKKSSSTSTNAPKSTRQSDDNSPEDDVDLDGTLF